jgi:hypothetical protein
MSQTRVRLVLQPLFQAGNVSILWLKAKPLRQFRKNLLRKNFETSPRLRFRTQLSLKTPLPC